MRRVACTRAICAGHVHRRTAGASAVHRLGRHHAMVFGLVGLAAGSVLLVAGRVAGFTLGGALLMGSLGTLVLVLVPAILADEHGASSAVALNEASVVSSSCAVLAPLLVGGLARTAFGWRTGFLLGGLILVPTVRQLRSIATPMGPASNSKPVQRRPLPPAYWVYWLLLVCCVSLEFSMIFWTADLHRRPCATGQRGGPGQRLSCGDGRGPCRGQLAGAPLQGACHAFARSGSDGRGLPDVLADRDHTGTPRWTLPNRHRHLHALPPGARQKPSARPRGEAPRPVPGPPLPLRRRSALRHCYWEKLSDRVGINAAGMQPSACSSFSRWSPAKSPARQHPIWKQDKSRTARRPVSERCLVPVARLPRLTLIRLCTCRPEQRLRSCNCGQWTARCSGY